MAKGIHKGTEFHNIGETWDENERNRPREGASRNIEEDNRAAAVGNDLDRTIHEEADEYDRDNKEDRVMGGERASVNDDPDR